MIRSVARVVAFAGLLAACSSVADAANTNNNVANADFNNLDNLDADLVDLLHANDGMKRKMQEDDAPTPSPSAEGVAFASMAPTMAATEGSRGIDGDVGETAAPTATPPNDVDREIEIGSSAAPTPAPTPGETSAASVTATVPIVLSMAAAVAAAAVVTVAM